MRATGSHHPATLVNHWALMALTWCSVGYIIENGIQFDMSHSQMLGKFEYGGGPIFKVVIEC